MPARTLIDAGPVVAFLNRHDAWHSWAADQFRQTSHFITCEPVLAEVCARLAYEGIDQWKVLDLLNLGVLVLEFDLRRRTDRVKALMEKYGDQPMDLADGCLVVMTEDSLDCTLVTLDREDFSVYRRNGREMIPFVSPGHRMRRRGTQ